jgi:hypothetical protein
VCYRKLFVINVVASWSHLGVPTPSVLLSSRYYIFRRYCQISSEDALRIDVYSRDTQNLNVVPKNAGKKFK